MSGEGDLYGLVGLWACCAVDMARPGGLYQARPAHWVEEAREVAVAVARLRRLRRIIWIVGGVAGAIALVARLRLTPTWGALLVQVVGVAVMMLTLAGGCFVTVAIRTGVSMRRMAEATPKMKAWAAGIDPEL